MKRFYFLLLLFPFLSLNFAYAQVNAGSQLTSNKSQASDGLTITVGQYTEVIPQQTLSSWINYKSEYLISTSKNEFENPNFCPIDKIVCILSFSTWQKQHLQLKSVAIVDQQKVKDYVQELAKKVNHEAQDAKFAVVDGKVSTFSEARDSLNLNVDKSLNDLTNKLQSENFIGQTVALSYDSKKANSNYGDVNNLGISALIGEGVSDFKGSPINRIKNIKAAVSHFNGLLIKPGEEFSFIKNLGDVDAEHGFFPELVIKQNVTEPEFGGGICQVSTTAFRAAIYSGLKITARRNHAYPVSYYSPTGMDSTVYVPYPDLKFINNTPGYILIQTKIVGTQLIFDFYGTDDGRKTFVDGPKVLEKQPDGAIKTTFTQHVYDKDGSEFINDVFNSSYQSPYKFPHLGGPVLKAKPSNWSDDEWKNYQQTLKDLAKAAKNAKQ